MINMLPKNRDIQRRNLCVCECVHTKAANLFIYLYFNQTKNRLLFLTFKWRKRTPCTHQMRTNFNTSCNARMTLMFVCCVFPFIHSIFYFHFAWHSYWKSHPFQCSIRIIQFRAELNSKWIEIVCWLAINYTPT